MNWQTRLVTTYLTVCSIFDQHGFESCLERMSNNHTVSLTDEEVLTIYLHGIMSHRRTLKSIYSFTFDHLNEWFPNLVTYEVFVRRINQMGESLPVFLENPYLLAQEPPLLDCFFYRLP